MTTKIQARISDEMQHPMILELWRGLQVLRSTVRFLNTGAHPDDETTAMLTTLALRDGVSIAFACANRGEGGQNDIGTESGATLGALRTAEMERAAAALNMRLYWLSQSPSDPITDFGLSKTGTETFEYWGRERTLARFVDIIRAEKPDIICPTFLDVPGQHGHHRAMTEAAHLAIPLAADAGYEGSSRTPWQVKKLYLPAWGGGGNAYDDEVPPPEATLTIRGKGRDPVTGWSYERIAQQSRAFHRTQGMGHWIKAGAERDWPLHLVRSELRGKDNAVTDGLAQSFADYAETPHADPIASDLRAGAAAIDRAIAAFPDCRKVFDTAAEALTHLRNARDNCPNELRHELNHRLDQKIAELSHVLYIASGAAVRLRLSDVFLTPGSATEYSTEIAPPLLNNVTVDTKIDLPDDWQMSETHISPGTDALPHDGYRDSYDPGNPPAPAMTVMISSSTVKAQTRIALETPPVLLPAHSASLAPDRLLLNLQNAPGGFDLTLAEQSPANAKAALSLPTGWDVTQTNAGFQISLPKTVTPGLYDLSLSLSGEAASSVTKISHPHIHPTSAIRAASCAVRIVDVAVPDARIAYIGGGNDRVDEWLMALGADVTRLSADTLTPETLAAFDTLLIGIFAFRFHAGLNAKLPLIHDWCRAGGNLVTLYHRPWDNWDAATTAPAPLEIGAPSLRWRVTDPGAEVTHLIPDHPLLNGPNKITDMDWQGWHKERGLYFAKSWDNAYQPLLSMADPDENPHQGSLLSADIGKGRHTHCALILHHQMEQLVPGAFALMANMIAGVRG